MRYTLFANTGYALPSPPCPEKRERGAQGRADLRTEAQQNRPKPGGFSKKRKKPIQIQIKTQTQIMTMIKTQKQKMILLQKVPKAQKKDPDPDKAYEDDTGVCAQSSNLALDLRISGVLRGSAWPFCIRVISRCRQSYLTVYAGLSQGQHHVKADLT